METLPVDSNSRPKRGMAVWLGFIAFLFLTVVLAVILGGILLEKHRFDFLISYSVAGGSILVAVYLVREIAENGELPKWNVTDPKLIACLRGGIPEVIRIATVSLVERGFLRLNWNVLIAVPEKSSTGVECPVERRILDLTRESQPASMLLSDRALQAECEPYEADLRKVGFAPDRYQIRRRFMLCVTGLFLVLGVGIAKVVMAVSQGKRNVWFTIGLMALFSIVLCFSVRPNRTRLGKKFLSGFQHLYRNSLFQSDRFRAEGRLDELVMMAAVFGFGALGKGKYAPDWFEVAESPSPLSLAQLDPNSANFSVGFQQPIPYPLYDSSISSDVSSSSYGGTSDWGGGGSIDYTTTSSSCGGSSFTCGGGSGSSCGSSSGSGCGG